MKVVLDTNVLLSGIFFSGSPHQVLRTWREGRYTLVVSPEIMDEYQRTAFILAESYPPVDLQSILAIIEENAESNPVPSLPFQICTDPDDDKFLACALSSGAKVIVSGDKHLLKVNGFHGILILRPKAFLDYLLSEVT